MSTNVNDTVERYEISGVGPYAYSFRIFADTDLTLVALSTDSPPEVVPLTLLTDYTVAGENEADGGTVTLVAGTATTYDGYTLDIRSNTPLEQPTSIRNIGRFLPEIHEDAYDNLSRQIQDVNRRVDACLRYPDNMLFDGAMEPIEDWTSKYVAVSAAGELEPATLTSSGAITQSIVGELLNPRTAAEIAAGVTPTSYAYQPLDARRYGTNTTPGTTNMTSAIQAAISVASAMDGGNVLIQEDMAISNVVLANGVYLVGPLKGEAIGSIDHGPKLVALATGTMVTTPGSTQAANCGVVGLGFYGMGSATPLIGVYLDNLIYGSVRWCTFNNFSDNAIKTDSDVIGCTFQQNYAINCLLDRTRAAKEGVLDVDGTDHRILEGEYTASVSALTDSNARCGAVVIRGGQHFVSNVVAEISDFG